MNTGNPGRPDLPLFFSPRHSHLGFIVEGVSRDLRRAAAPRIRKNQNIWVPNTPFLTP